MSEDNQVPGGGVTPTEQLLFDLCRKSFLRLWSFANPFKDDGHEFCDVLVLFENHVLIFFDRAKQFVLPEKAEDFRVAWERWKRTAVEAQTRTAHGAERYLRSGRPLFLDAKQTRPFPLKVNLDTLIVHKIIVAHGAADACRSFSDENISGSLAIAYGPEEPPDHRFDFPFQISVDRNRPIHVFDSSSLPILLSELDTIRDFTRYLDAKADAISKLTGLAYCGEEDLLAHYLRNMDADNHHFIGTDDKAVDLIMIEEGHWQEFQSLPQYKATKLANRRSYLWDMIINKTCDNFLKGQLLGDSDLYSQRSAVVEMAREPRFIRRALADLIDGAVKNFPADRSVGSRLMRCMPSIDPGRAYVFLQIWIPEHLRTNDDEDREKRQEILAIACGAAKNRLPQLHTVVGIGIEPPKLVSRIGEDFVLLNCSDWPDERRKEFEERNEGWNFFKSDSLQQFGMVAREFVMPTTTIKSAPTRKLGRNDPCHCGSGKKYKRCHGP